MLRAPFDRSFSLLVVAGTLVSTAWCFSTLAAEGGKNATGEFPASIAATDPAGQPLNCDFERGNLVGWRAGNGEAFADQPIDGDTVAVRRAGDSSGHAGRYWIGGYERHGDAPTGTLTSPPIRVTHPWASFLVGGGAGPRVRVEIIRHDTHQVVAEASGTNRETMRRVAVDLSAAMGENIFVRVVDQHSGPWGHINFDDFVFHAEMPDLPLAAPPPEVDQYQHAGLPPEEAARVMRVPSGFSVSLFAGEPDVHQPIAQAIDDRGRLWVAEAYSYPFRVPQEAARDKILIFEDTDGDGRFDKRKTFIDGLNLVSGLELGFGGVWVGAAPELLFIPDANGDDAPDGPPQVVLDGWGYQDTHETLNSFIWGPDGWLYGCHGVFTHSRVGKPGTADAARVAINAGIWRFHPVRYEFEVFAHGTSNPWGFDFDDRGQGVLTACVIPHLFHIIQGARYHRQAGQHFNPYTYDDIKTVAQHRHWVGTTPHSGNNRSDSAGGGHAHSGAMIYLGGAWPEEYRDQIFMNNIHGARLNMDRLARRGSGYVGDRAPDFLMANDVWSQIINLQYGPDGQMYMIDWYDKNQCHRREAEVHDRTNGRIFKVSYGATKPAHADLAKLSDAELVELQLSENDWYVRHARRLLQERGADRDAQAALAELALTHADETRALRGLWALHVTGGLSDELVDKLLASDHEYVRAWTIQLALEDGRLTDAQLDRLSTLANGDPSPVVRLYIASATGRLPHADRWPLLTALLNHSEDAADHNLPLMYWYAAEPLANDDAERLLSMADAGQIPLVLEFASRRVTETRGQAGLQIVTSQLGRERSVNKQLAILNGMNQALAGRRRAEMPSGWAEASSQLLASSDANLRSVALAVATTFGDPAAMAELKRVASDAQADVARRREALAALVKARPEYLVAVLQDLVADAELRREALRGLASFDDAKTPQIVLDVYPSLTLDERRDALATLAARPSFAHALLDAVARGDVSHEDLSADLVRQLRNHQDSSLMEKVAKVWGTVQDTPEERLRQMAEYRRSLMAAADQKPDLSLGRAVFAKNCQQCHKLFDAGANVGPELTGSNRTNLDYVLSNVLDPSAVIGKDYQATIIATADGRVLTGIVRAEDAASVTLVTANETLVLPNDEIDERVLSTKSMMPDDLWKALSEHDIRSLVAYLASPEQVALPAGFDATATGAGQ